VVDRAGAGAGAGGSDERLSSRRVACTEAAERSRLFPGTFSNFSTFQLFFFFFPSGGQTFFAGHGFFRIFRMCQEMWFLALSKIGLFPKKVGLDRGFV
jgi:hypothetical protein